MKISDIGEFGFIDAIKDNTLFAPDSVRIGIGDDGAVYTTTPGMEQIAVIDTMVENSHFIIQRTADWYDVGIKAVASNLSDIAAMGGKPTHIVLSTAIAGQMEVDSLLELYRGIKDICRSYKVNIIGGDTVMSKEGLVITVAAFGEIEAGCAIRRGGALAGDIVAVSHSIGNSAAGLDIMLHDVDGYEFLKEAHRLPKPQIELGRLLVRHHCHSLNDISDGLASESNEIAKASNVELLLDRSTIPVSKELCAWSEAAGQDIWQYVFYGGEDYELIFTMSKKDFFELQKEFPDVTQIGVVHAGNSGVKLVHDGITEPLLPMGFHHFNEES
jgi:thiamine-monophosphate kinase